MSDEGHIQAEPAEVIPRLLKTFSVKGIPFMRNEGGQEGYKYERIVNVIPNLQTRSSDVLLVSWPRGGTHWTKYILGCIFADGKLEVARDTLLNDQVQYLEFDDAQHLEDNAGEPPQPVRWEQATKPRLFNSHMDWTLVPPGFREGQGKVVLLIRNPKDAAVSLYHFFTKMSGAYNFEGSFDDFFFQFIEGKITNFGGRDYFSFMKGWLEQRNNIPMLIVHFEDIKRNPQNEIRRLSEFLDRPLSDDEIATIASMTEFKTMRSAKCIAKYDKLAQLRDGSTFMRKGMVGDWKNVLTVNQSEEIDRRIEQLKGETGYLIKQD